MVRKLSWKHHFPVAEVESSSPKYLGSSVTSRLQDLRFNIQDFPFPPSATSDHSDQHLETRKRQLACVTYLQWCQWSQGSWFLWGICLPTLRPPPAILINSKSAMEEAVPLSQGTACYQYKHSVGARLQSMLKAECSHLLIKPCEAFRRWGNRIESWHNC